MFLFVILQGSRSQREWEREVQCVYLSIFTLAVLVTVIISAFFSLSFVILWLNPLVFLFLKFNLHLIMTYTNHTWYDHNYNMILVMSVYYGFAFCYTCFGVLTLFMTFDPKKDYSMTIYLLVLEARKKKGGKLNFIIGINWFSVDIW